MPKSYGPIRRFARILLSFRGRLRRPQFWLAVVLVFVGGAFTSQSQDAAGAVVGIITLWVTIAVYGKRLHDFNRTAWHMIVPVTVAIGAQVYAVILVADAATSSNIGHLRSAAEQLQVIWFALTAFWLIVTMFLGLIPGTKGDNRFGMDPREQKALPTGPPTVK